MSDVRYNIYRTSYHIRVPLQRLYVAQRGNNIQATCNVYGAALSRRIFDM